MEHVRAGELDVAYLDAGEARGSPIILLHGFPSDLHCFDEVVPRLTAEGHHVIVPCLRGYGATRFVDDSTMRVGQQAALGSDLLALLDALDIERATLAGFDWSGRAACVVAALHPERVVGLVSGGSGCNIQNSDDALKPVNPATEQRCWYWYYLNTDRGAAALSSDRAGFCRHLWSFFSPTWRFDEATYRRTAASFDNPDFVAVVLHSYRYRIGAVAGDPALAAMEHALLLAPPITVPTIVLSGADDGVDRPADEATLAARFPRLWRHRSAIVPTMAR